MMPLPAHPGRTRKVSYSGASVAWLLVSVASGQSAVGSGQRRRKRSSLGICTCVLSLPTADFPLRTSLSMIKQKFTAIEQCPEEVFQGLRFLGARNKRGEQGVTLF